MEDPLSNKYAGIYYDPKDRRNLRSFLNRQLFLRAAARTVPGFAESLFKVTWTLIGDSIARNGSLPVSDTPTYHEFWSRLYDAIRDWASSFHIEADWVLNEARDAAFSGLVYTQKGIDPVKSFGTWRRPMHAGRALRAFQLPAWDARLESESDYIVRADTAWKQIRDEYIAATKLELAEAGMKAVPKRRKRRVAAELRIEWAALHRCAGMRIEELADRYCEDNEVIRVSVARVLKDLDFDSPT